MIQQIVILGFVGLSICTNLMAQNAPAGKPKPTTINSKTNLPKPIPAQPIQPPKGLDLQKFSMALAPTFFVPVGSLALSSKPGGGLQYQLWYNFNRSWSCGFGTGIFLVNRKNANTKAGHVIPYTLGLKFTAQNNLYFDMAAGIIRDQGEYGSSPFFKGGKPFVIQRFAYRAGLGYKINPTWDLGIRFEGASINSWVALMLSYKFVNKEIKNEK